MRQLGFSHAPRLKGPLKEFVERDHSRDDVAGPPDEKPHTEHQPDLSVRVVVQPNRLVDQFLDTEGNPCNKEESQYDPLCSMAFHVVSTRVPLESSVSRGASLTCPITPRKIRD
jgi:hypothetical protein